MRKTILFVLWIGAVTVALNGANTFPSSGNVGIGTTSPEDLLHIKTGTHDNIFSLERTSSGNQNNHFEFIISANPGGASSLANGSLSIRAMDRAVDFSILPNPGLNHPLLVLKASGKLAVGHANPTMELDVLGQNILLHNTSGSGLHMRTDSSGNSFVNNMDGFVGNGTTANGFFAITGQTGLYFKTGSSGSSGTERMRIMDSTGYVGINTQTPDYQLDVKGVIRAEEVIVETGWSDFVFEAGYELKPLHEVEEFIEVNGHLPDVPSAEEVEAEGVTLGESQAVLLQKIEELTLYIIEQEKRIQALEDELAEQ